MYNKDEIIELLTKEKFYIDSFIFDAFIKNWSIEPIYENENNVEYYDDETLAKIRDGLHGKAPKPRGRKPKTAEVVEETPAPKATEKKETKAEDEPKKPAKRGRPPKKAKEVEVIEAVDEKPKTTVEKDSAQESVAIPPTAIEVDEDIVFEPAPKAPKKPKTKTAKTEKKEAPKEEKIVEEIIPEIVVEKPKAVAKQEKVVEVKQDKVKQETPVAEKEPPQKQEIVEEIIEISKAEVIEIVENDDDEDDDAFFDYEFAGEFQVDEDENIPVKPAETKVEVKKEEPQIKEAPKAEIKPEPAEDKSAPLKDISKKMDALTTPIIIPEKEDKPAVAKSFELEPVQKKKADLKNLTVDISNQTLSLLAGALAQKISSEVSQHLKNAEFIEKAINAGEIKSDNKALRDKLKEVVADNKVLIQKLQALDAENKKFVKVVGNLYKKID